MFSIRSTSAGNNHYCFIPQQERYTNIRKFKELVTVLIIANESKLTTIFVGKGTISPEILFRHWTINRILVM